MPEPQPGRGVGQVQDRLSNGAGRHPAAHHRPDLAGETVQLGIETSVRRSPRGSRQGPAMPAGDDQEGNPELQQGDQRGGVSLMGWGNKPYGTALMFGALALLALPIAVAR